MADLQKIQFLRTKTSGRWPTTNQISEGELAINLQDRLLFTNDGNGNIINLGFAKGGNVDGNITVDRDNSMIRLGNDKDIAFVKQAGTHGFVAVNNTNPFIIKRSADGAIDPASQFNTIFTVSGQGDVYASTFNGPLHGNADTATKFQTGRYIYGNWFDGSFDLNGDIKSTTGMFYGKDNYHFIDLGSGSTNNVTLGTYAADFIIKDSYNNKQLFRMNADGSADTTGRQKALYLFASGSTSPDTTNQGAYLNWNLSGGQGETDFINNQGQGVGGFTWYNTADGKSYNQLANLGSNGWFTISGALKSNGVVSNGMVSSAAIKINCDSNTDITSETAALQITGQFGGGLSLRDSTSSTAAAFYMNGGALEINVGKTGNNGLAKSLTIDPWNQLHTSSNIISGGFFQTMNGLIKSNDDYHYIDLGQVSNNRINLGVYGGLFNFIDAGNGNNIFNISPSNLTYNGSTLATLKGNGSTVNDTPTFTGNINVNRDVVVSGWIYAPYMTGTAQKTKQLETPRRINGTIFDGTADIQTNFPFQGTINTNSSYTIPWDAPGGFYVAGNPGVDSNIVMHSGNIGGSTPALQIRASYQNGAIWFKSARDSAGFEKDWTKICTETDGMAIAAKRLEQTRSIFGNSYNGTQDVNGDIYLDKPWPCITLKEGGFGDAAQIVFASDGADDSNKLLFKTSVGGSGAIPSYSTAMSILAKSQFVGIGTETPGQKLDVNGNIWANGNIRAAGAISGNSLTSGSTITATGNIWTDGAIRAGGDITTATGMLWSNDGYHYINVGRAAANTQEFGTWGGAWSFKNTQSGNAVTTIDSNGNMQVASINVLAPWGNPNNGLFPGNGDGASIATTNMDIGSWWGIGFYDKCYSKRSGFIDVRAGNLSMIGTVIGNNGVSGYANARGSEFDYANYAIRTNGDKSGGLALMDANVTFGMQAKFGYMAISSAGSDKWWFTNSDSSFKSAGPISAGGQLTGDTISTVNWIYAGAEIGGNRITSRSGSFWTDQYHYLDVGNSNGGNDRMNLGTYNGMFNFINTNGTVTKATINANTGDIWSAGTITANGDVVAFSDKKLKENLEIIDNPLDKISKLSGYTYDRIDQDNRRSVGLIAQDVQKVLPEAVTETDGTLGVNYNGVTAALVEAVKALQKEVEELRRQVYDAK